METVIPDRLATLGHPQRLAIFRMLMRRFPDRVPAGEIAAALSLKASTLSAYLSALLQAGLVTQDRHGTSRRYTIDMTQVRQTLDYLFLDCCRGRPDLCTPLSLSLSLNPTLSPLPAPTPGNHAMTEQKYNVLFLCTGNSARSIFAEAILRADAGDRFNAYSAGTRPFSELNPFAVDVLRAKGHDIGVLRSKHMSEFQSEDAIQMDFVFTVCDHAANEDCPAWAGQPVTAHWSTPDPVAATGSDAERSLAFQHAYGALRNRISAFAALPLATLDRVSLQKAVDDLARQTPDVTA